MKKQKDSNFASDFLRSLLEFIDVASVNKRIIQEALYSDIKDFEDAVLDQTAQNQTMDFIITMNIKDFNNSRTNVKQPGDFLNQFISVR